MITFVYDKCKQGVVKNRRRRQGRRSKAVCNYCYQMCWYTLMPLDAKVVDNSQEPRRVALQADRQTHKLQWS